MSPARRPEHRQASARILEIHISMNGSFTSRTSHFFQEGKMAATVRDVATYSGVSIATVSRVLNNPMIVSQKTKDKVQAAIESLQFMPNPNAAALRRNYRPKEKRSPRTSSALAAARNAPAPHLSNARPVQRASDRLGALRQENRMLKRLLRRFNRDVVKCLDSQKRFAREG
jgi:DNA-binding transcriptional MocR family regulator